MESKSASVKESNLEDYKVEATKRSSSDKSTYFNLNLRNKRNFYKNQKGKYGKNMNEAPNYFVALQVSNPEIHKSVLNVQKTMQSSNEKLSGTFVDVATLHITLFVVHIPTEDQLHIASSALDDCGARLSKSLSEDPLHLKFSGISHFNNKVIFAKLVEDDEYKRFLSAVNLIKKEFRNREILLPNDKFSPHLTIAKFSKLFKNNVKTNLWRIDRGTYASEVNRYFGEQIVTGLQLLSMEDREEGNRDRYYYSEREILFDVVSTESSDHSECCYPTQAEDPINTTKNNSTDSDIASASASLTSD